MTILNPKYPQLSSGDTIISCSYLYHKRNMASGHTLAEPSDAHLHHLTTIPTKYQLPTHYGFGDKAGTRL